MTTWRQGVLTQLGRDGAGVLVDRESGEAYGLGLAMVGGAEDLVDGTPVRFLLNGEGEVAVVETRESLLRLAESLAGS